MSCSASDQGNSLEGSHPSGSPHLVGLVVTGGDVKEICAALAPEAAPWDKDVMKVRRVPTGWNNCVFLVEGSDTRFALRVSAMSWPERKHVQELKLLQALPMLLPSVRLPVVRGHDVEGKAVAQCEVRSLLMDAVDGECMVDVWGAMSNAAQERALAQMVAVIAALQAVVFPRAGAVDMTSDVVGEANITPAFDNEWMGTPARVQQYYEARLEYMYERSKKSQGMAAMHEAADEAYRVAREVLARVDLDKGSRMVLSHGDLAFRNVMVDCKTGELQAVLDWEWGCSAPIEVDLLDGFDDLEDVSKQARRELLDRLAPHFEALGESVVHYGNMPNFAVREALFAVFDQLSPWDMTTASESELPAIADRARAGLGSAVARLREVGLGQ
ncbi:uncharacterized protein AMSG_04181 [Thecamonas trahens ATCC 50062]|uniref:Aminoglycoside phosphotransferase domain-containing protein n=1 Tax=Thecamonas trahens ATCC 50062 TaxID=461836 RepID=A0A0L0D6D5_THETB|nr:hypothetical protein AMSG_04181 [Thecamonas trahens ATCC 50062]KNC47947.1 hypothetical protein AMSG_04181 [Thecamonas trahens ATCC 50062]|eukprot:XP_013758964.1 hypothetical protein AMSG_04181 [Thecamonas trahens ATCC 50062]